MKRFITIIKPNERLLKTTFTGKVKFIDGPKFVVHPFSKVDMLKTYSASIVEFLEITKKTGEIEIIKGPSVIYENPLEHNNITIRPNMFIPNN